MIRIKRVFFRVAQLTGVPRLSDDDLLHTLRSARRAGCRLIVPPDVSRHVLDTIVSRGLARYFMGHVVVTEFGKAQLRLAV